MSYISHGLSPRSMRAALASKRSVDSARKAEDAYAELAYRDYVRQSGMPLCTFGKRATPPAPNYPVCPTCGMNTNPPGWCCVDNGQGKTVTLPPVAEWACEPVTVDGNDVDTVDLAALSDRACEFCPPTGCDGMGLCSRAD